MRARSLTIALLAAALVTLPACFSRNSARASYWKGVEQTAKRPSSARQQKSASAKEKRPKSYRAKRSSRKEAGKLAAVRGLLETLLEHGWLVRVKPWERDVLALEEMGWDPDALQTARRSHIYFSKESSLGGGSAGGGGCGCN